jgi:anhydro-N-acetylmuramic acid kinase
MEYKVIGLMSGSSLDGLDIVYVCLEENRGQWKFDILEAECIPYTADWVRQLKNAQQASVPEFVKLNTAYGRYLGEQVNSFIHRYNIQHAVHFIASHGHTVFHEPANHTSYQVGEGSTIAAITGLPVISDLRNMDVALGGQGAPIVPIGDKLLFSKFDYWLNIGGIANITVRNGEELLAFDVCPANQVLNALAEREGKPFDYEGEMAMQGKIIGDVLHHLNAQAYYHQDPPKSLSNEAAKQLAFPILFESEHSNFDMLRTVVQHIACQVGEVVKKYPTGKEQASMLMTGGGSLNNFLAEEIRKVLAPMNVNGVVPYEQVANYKEALVMALIGALRWREETNVMGKLTGASRDSISGALWMGHSYSGD